MTDKRARLNEIDRDWGWWTLEARYAARLWMASELEAAWAEVERLRGADNVVVERELETEAAEKRVKVLDGALRQIIEDSESSRQMEEGHE